MKYTVYGTVHAQVSIKVDAANKDEAIEKAYEEFGGITSYCGNGGNDKLIGVSGSDESIEADGEVEFTEALAD